MKTEPRVGHGLSRTILSVALVVTLCVGSEVAAQSQPAGPVAPAPPSPVDVADAGNAGGVLDDGLPTDGLVAHWMFDEPRGPLAQEPAGNHVALIDGAERVWDTHGPSLRFDGDDDRVLLPQSAIDAVGDLDQGSISLWFRFEDTFATEPLEPLLHFGIDNATDVDNIISIEVGHASPFNKRLYITWTVNGVLPLCFDNGYNLEPDTWYHFVAVVSPTGNTGFLNGVEMVDRQYNAGNPNSVFFFSAIPSQERLRLGHGKSFDAVSPQFQYLDGGLADVRIYDRPLDADEVFALYDRTPLRPDRATAASTDG